MIKSLVNKDFDTILEHSYLAMLIGFLIFSSTNAVNTLFYITFIIPTFLLIIKQKKQAFFKNSFNLILLTFAFWMFISTFWAENPKYKEIRSILLVLTFIWGLSLIDKEKIFKKWGWSLALALTIQLTLSKNYNTRLSGFGSFENSLYASHYYLFFSWLFLFVKEWHLNKKISSIIKCYGLIISSIGCILCQSRSAFIGLIFLYFFAFMPYSLLKSKRFIIVLISLFLTFLFYLQHKNWYSLPKRSFSYTINTTSTTTVIINKKINNISINLISKDENIKLSKKRYILQANKQYKLEVVFPSLTYVPWDHINILVQNTSTPNSWHSINTPPRLLQFSSSIGYRKEIWKDRYNDFLNKPLAGHGFSNQQTVITNNGKKYNDAHNFFLGTAYCGGLIGLTFYCLLLAYTSFNLIKAKDLKYLGLFACGIIVTCFDDEDFFNSPRAYWLLLLTPIAKALEIHIEHFTENNS